MEINIVELNARLYGINTACVCEVLQPTLVTPLPFAAEYVDGLINLGGSIVVQIDLSVKLEQARHLPLDSGQLVVIEQGEGKIALHVDRVLQMVEVMLDANEIQSTGQKSRQLLVCTRRH